MAKTIILYDAGGLKFIPHFQKGESNGVRVPFGSDEALETVVARVIAAAGKDKISTLRIFAHGREGFLQMGGDSVGLTVTNIAKLSALKAILDDPATIEIHGCEVAQNASKNGSAGYKFMKTLSDTTKASVTAADAPQLLSSDDPSDTKMEGTVHTFLPTP